ncbi:MAG: 16S rRNA (uracil(1498)-N(3))-methyltransferase [Magnetococcales bacterium]|nr:16S rRNA (uracil(1498)-N(3))-methyltransferase [Magnetococcales bacterium]
MIRLAEVPAHLDAVVPLADAMEEELACWQARVGDVLTMVDPDGFFFRARLLPSRREVVVFETVSRAVEPLHPRWLCPAIPDRERMLVILQKAVELGATDIIPLVTEHSSAAGGRRHGQDKSATWSRIVLQAARQCRRAILPRLHARQSLRTFLAESIGGKTAFLDTREPRMPLNLWHDPHQALAIMCGPEGGWSEEERLLMLEHHVTAVSLGRRLLRTETAAVAAMAVVTMLDDTFT